MKDKSWKQFRNKYTKQTNKLAFPFQNSNLFDIYYTLSPTKQLPVRHPLYSLSY